MCWKITQETTKKKSHRKIKQTNIGIYVIQQLAYVHKINNSTIKKLKYNKISLDGYPNQPTQKPLVRTFSIVSQKQSLKPTLGESQR